MVREPGCEAHRAVDMSVYARVGAQATCVEPPRRSANVLVRYSLEAIFNGMGIRSIVIAKGQSK